METCDANLRGFWKKFFGNFSQSCALSPDPKLTQEVSDSVCFLAPAGLGLVVWSVPQSTCVVLVCCMLSGLRCTRAPFPNSKRNSVFCKSLPTSPYLSFYLCLLSRLSRFSSPVWHLAIYLLSFFHMWHIMWLASVAKMRKMFTYYFYFALFLLLLLRLAFCRACSIIPCPLWPFICWPIQFLYSELAILLIMTASP